MAKRGVQSAISRLTTTRKWVLFSAVLVGFSAIMPWYEDLDAFGAGDLYLGITGPLFMVGLMILGSSALVSYWIMAPAMGKRLPNLPVKEGALFTFLGIQDLLLLLVANSVFFHPKFGVNITLKNTKFGMIVAALGTIVLIWSGYKLFKSEERRTASFGPEGRLEPLIKMPEPKREAPRDSGHRDPAHYSGGIGTRSHGPVEHSVGRLNNEVSPPAPPTRHEPIDRTTEAQAEPQPLRLDL
jgi:hypothetical protein